MITIGTPTVLIVALIFLAAVIMLISMNRRIGNLQVELDVEHRGHMERHEKALAVERTLRDLQQNGVQVPEEKPEGALPDMQELLSWYLGARMASHGAGCSDTMTCDFKVSSSSYDIALQAAQAFGQLEGARLKAGELTLKPWGAVELDREVRRILGVPREDPTLVRVLFDVHEMLMVAQPNDPRGALERMREAATKLDSVIDNVIERLRGQGTADGLLVPETVQTTDSES